MLLGISGSPRNTGNSVDILKHILKNCEAKGIETEFINLGQINIAGCIACGSCKKELKCSHDEEFNKLIPILKKAKMIVVSSPVYFGNVTAQLKAFMDKSVVLRRNGFLLEGVFGAGISVGGSRNGGQELTLMAIHNWMLIHGMTIISDGAPTSHWGGTLVASSLGDAIKDQTGLETVKSLENKIIKTWENYIKN